MIHAYAQTLGKVFKLPLEPGLPLPGGTVWLDLVNPTDAERTYVAKLVGIELPTHEEMKEIEVSSRLYVEDGIAYLTTPVITNAESEHPETGVLTFIQTTEHLVTLRYIEPKSIETFANRLIRQPELLASAEDALLGILDAIIDRAADVLELIGMRLDVLGSQVFTDKPPIRTGQVTRKPAALQEVVRGIGRVGDLIHKLRDSLAGLERLVAYHATVNTVRMSKDQKVTLKTLNRDLRSLGEHAGFLAHQTNFLLDATLGMINIEQNAIIKIFSVVAVVFLPPTLIASIYGMNFQFMPELDEPIGYPLALLLMVISAVVPLLYFRRKGWL